MIEVKSLSKRFGHLWALKNTTWSVQEGQSLGLLGPNGAGKSTTMKIMTGLLCASEGEVLIDGQNIMTQPVLAKRKIGYLSEAPPLYDELKVYDFFNFICGLKSVPQHLRAGQMDLVIDKLKLQEVAFRQIRNLSKGFRQRVGIAQALLGEPRILILDEPSVGLDPHQVFELRNIIKELKRDHIIVLSTHILSEVQQICDHVVILDKGEVRTQGPLTEVLKQGQGQQQQIIIIHLSEYKEGLEVLLKKLPGVLKIELDDKTLHLLLESQKVPDLNIYINAIMAHGCGIRSIEQKQQHLEDVFIEVTR